MLDCKFGRNVALWTGKEQAVLWIIHIRFVEFSELKNSMHFSCVSYLCTVSTCFVLGTHSHSTANRGVTRDRQHRTKTSLLTPSVWKPGTSFLFSFNHYKSVRRSFLLSHGSFCPLRAFGWRLYHELFWIIRYTTTWIAFLLVSPDSFESFPSMKLLTLPCSSSFMYRFYIYI